MESNFNHQLSEGYTIRPARLEDLENTVAMFNACSRMLTGREENSLQETRAFWTSPGFDMEADTRLVIAPGGEVAGYYDVSDMAPYIQPVLWGQVHPQYRGVGISTCLLVWAEARARQLTEQAPPEAQVTSRMYCLSIDQSAHEFITLAGYQPIRYSLRMVIDLDGFQDIDVLPEKIQVSAAVLGRDEEVVYQVVHESFRDHWGYVEHPFEEAFANWKHFWLNHDNYDPGLWFLATEADQITGVCLCLPSADDDPDMGWVSTLGVLRPWRKRGIGLALLKHSFSIFAERGKKRAGLLVDSGSLTGATRLYEKAGMHQDPDRQYTIYEKILRPGIVLSKLSL